MADLRPKLSQVPGIRVYMINQPPINLGNQGGQRSLYQFTLQDTDTEELYHWAPILEAKLRDLPGLEDVNSDMQVQATRRVRVDMDRDKIAALGLIGEPGRDRALQRLRHASGLANLRAEQSISGHHAGRAAVPERSGGAVDALRSGDRRPADSRSTRSRAVRTNVGPSVIAHTGQLPSVTISFNLKPGYALGDAVDAIKATAGVHAAVEHQHDVPGRGAGVPGFAAGPRPHPR